MSEFEIEQKDLDESFVIVDIRTKQNFEFGHIDGAINLSEEEIENFDFKDKEICLCSRDGKKAFVLAEKLKEKGINAKALKGGYVGFLSSKENLSYIKAEQSLKKKFGRELLTPFSKAINRYDLIKPGDKIAVCMSGGKDSFCMAKLFQEIKRHNKLQFELCFLVMDPGYSKENRKLLEDNAKKLNIPITIFETDIFENVVHIKNSPCYVCSRMRRGHLYNKAKELGFNKIALGHHYDDVIETILMGMLYGAQVQTMMPKLHSNNFEGMELIRPMYLIREKDIIRWRDFNDLKFLQCACKFTEQNYKDGLNENEINSKRKTIKNLIKSLSHKEHQIEGNIFKSVENVNLSTIISFKDYDGKHHSFLDDYDKIKLDD